MRALNKIEIEELFNEQMVRQNRHQFDEKEQIKLAEKILHDEKNFMEEKKAEKLAKELQ